MNDSSPDRFVESEKTGDKQRTGLFFRFCLLAGVVQLILGTLLRLTVRDRIPYLAAIYYASPTIVLALLCVLLAFGFGYLKRKRIGYGFLSLGLIFGGWWHLTTHYTNPQDASNSDETHSILLWNVRYVKAGWPKILKEVQQHDPDLIGFVEVGPGFNELMNQIRYAFPEHDLRFVGMGVLLVRGRWGEIDVGTLNRRGTYARAEALFENGDRLDVVLVDIFAQPWLPRGPAYNALELVARNENENPVLVMGDFNTPPDSVFVDTLREMGLANAFEVAGRGYHVTWPVGVPVLALDQIWLDPKSVRECQLYDSAHSDHRIVTAKFVDSSQDSD